jgi:hypothetical protein
VINFFKKSQIPNPNFWMKIGGYFSFLAIAQVFNMERWIGRNGVYWPKLLTQF